MYGVLIILQLLLLPFDLFFLTKDKVLAHGLCVLGTLSVHFETYDTCQCKYLCCCYCSVTKSCLTLRPHRLQHSRLPCPSLSPGVCSNSCPSGWWCYLTISSSAAPSPFTFNLSQHQGLSSEPVLRIMWPKYWSFSISPSNEYSGLISFTIDRFDLLAVQGTLKSLL